MDKDLKFFVSAALFLLVVSLPVLVILLLPVDQFSYTAYGALSFHGGHEGGPFYPNIRLEKYEEGDLAYGTKYSVEKKVKWFTDAYGYRNMPFNGTYDIVIIGDSYALGNRLSQESMLSEVIMARTGLKVYTMASTNIDSYLKDQRFMAHPPKAVIVEYVERSMAAPPPVTLDEAANYYVRHVQLSGNPGPQEYRPADRTKIFMDRVAKLSLVKYLKTTRVNLFNRTGNESVLGQKPNPYNDLYNPGTGMFFIKDALPARQLNRQKLDATVASLETYGEFFRHQKIRFIYLPVPDKETIYNEMIPKYANATYDGFLPDVTKRLRAQDIAVIDAYTAFMDAKQKGVLLYQLDDTHWNENGVNLTAELVIDELGRLQLLNKQ
ncbi:hypothetical protein HYY74_01630 [Candidatus Woesearchaeota archaeon]|nr:hypothetical protein [Candidatus Woesearchaeota archaeon]